MPLDTLLSIPGSAEAAMSLATVLALGAFLVMGGALLFASLFLMDLLPDGAPFRFSERLWAAVESSAAVLLIGIVALGALEASKPVFHAWLTADQPVTAETACLRATERVLTDAALADRLDDVVTVCGAERTLAAAVLVADDAPAERRQALARVARDALGAGAAD